MVGHAYHAVNERSNVIERHHVAIVFDQEMCPVFTKKYRRLDQLGGFVRAVARGLDLPSILASFIDLVTNITTCKSTNLRPLAR